jgi:predicted ArsR family transcriptional regulator
VEFAPTRLSTLLGHLQHPLRVPILLALQRSEMSAAALAEQLDAPFHSVNYAVSQLRNAGYVQLVRVDPPAPGTVGNTTRRIYGGTGEDWSELVECLERYARDV